MARRWTVATGLVALAVGLLVATAQAGGWATVTLDKPIAEPRAGEMVDVGFMVKQHDVTPVHSAFGEPINAVFVAQHQETGERLRVQATPAETVGHFVAQVSFPKAGTWLPEVIPAPFAGTKLSPVNVLTATGAWTNASAADEASIARALPAAVAPSPDTSGRPRDVVIAVGLVAGALALTGVVAFGWRERLTRG
ncbi:MAG: hypothetical protein ACRDJE_11965 [Dehalococcoidia bacterium]